MKTRINCRKMSTSCGEWAVENVKKIYPSKRKAIRFTRARVKDQLNYSLMDSLIPEASSCEY